MLILDRLWAQMTDTDQRVVKDTVNGPRRKGRKVVCPHCEDDLCHDDAQRPVGRRHTHDQETSAPAERGAPSTTGSWERRSPPGSWTRSRRR
jgi:hypothetical protein